jgi:ADP-heptose:LPS heptosyltransferase
VRFYSSTSFPNDSENRRFVGELVARLAETRPVVVVETGLTMDEHEEVPAAVAANVIRLGRDMAARDNLDLQSRIVANADLFVGTYGGLSYVAGFYGVPSLAIWSAHSGWRPIHLETADRVFKNLDVSFSQMSTEAARRVLGLA